MTVLYMYVNAQSMDIGQYFVNMYLCLVALLMVEISSNLTRESNLRSRKLG